MVVFSHESTMNFISLRKKCSYSDLFWFVFSRIISPYSVRMPENKEQNNSEHRHFSRSMWVTCNSDYSLLFWSNWSRKATIHILIQLWNFEFQGNKEILVICVWYRKTSRTKTITTYPWVVFHMALWSVFLEKVWGTLGKRLICWEDIFVGGSGVQTWRTPWIFRKKVSVLTLLWINFYYL